MWHGSYVSWLEEARVEALAAAGMPYGRVSEGYEMPVVGLVDVSPCLGGDLVTLESEPCRVRVCVGLGPFCLPDGTCAAEAAVELVLLRVANGKRGVVREAPAALAEALAVLMRGEDHGWSVVRLYC